MINKCAQKPLGKEFPLDTIHEAKSQKELARNRFMAENEKYMYEAAKQFFLAEVDAGRMEETENWHYPLFEDVYELMERLGIKDRVIASLNAKFEEEYALMC